MNETENPTKSLEERIIEAIVANGGIAEDVQYLSEEVIMSLGLDIAAVGIKARTPNPAFVVTPLNDIKGNMKNFDWAYDHLAKLTFKVESNDGPKTIELIKCEVGETEDVLKEIDGRGFMPAPSPYVLGLGVQHPDVIKEHEYIVSLDEQNVLLSDFGNPCFLRLYWDDERDLDLADRAVRWDGRWWFAVVRK